MEVKPVEDFGNIHLKKQIIGKIKMDEKETYQWAMRTVVKFFKTLLGKYVFKGISNQYKEAVIYVCVQLLLDNRKVLNDLPKEDQQILLRAIKIIQEKNNPKCK